MKELGAKEGEWKDGKLIEKNKGKESPLLIFIKEEKDMAESLLKDKKIDAIILPKAKVEFQIAHTISDVIPSILSQVLEGFEQYENAKESIQESIIKGEIIPKIKSLQGEEGNELKDYKEIDTENRKKGVAPNHIFQFTTLAYLGFFPIATGIHAMKNHMADQSLIARRKDISPISKGKRFIYLILPLLIFHFILISVTYGYCLLLGSNYGPNHFSIITLLCFGSTAAIFTGTAIGSILKAKEGLKEALQIGLPLLFSFFSGLMSQQIHSIIMEKAPFLHNYNPLGMITNGLYILFMEGTTSRYFQQLLGLGIYIFICLLITGLQVRRTGYESI